MKYYKHPSIGRILVVMAGIVVAWCLSFSVLSAREADCRLSMAVSYTPVQHLGLADVDVEHFESSTLLFAIQIANTDKKPLDARLHVTLFVTLSDGASYSPAVEFFTEPFKVSEAGKTITNLDIGKTREIKTESFEYDHAAKDRLQDIALGTGSFPAGRYVFHISLEQVPGGQCDFDKVVYILQNDSRVELRSPRDGETTNEFPFFEFYQDASRAALTVTELQNGQSRDDAITRKPPMLEVDVDGQNSFLYSGGRPLEQGKTYVWQVASKVRVAGGTDNIIASPIWSFTVSGTGAETSMDAILHQLEEMFGARYGAIFTQIRNGNFRPTGRYSENNSTLTQNELLNLLNELRNLSDTAELSLD